eukprot:scaffold457659_cov18-Prasinocladus_malaysianus.AAC.1
MLLSSQLTVATSCENGIAYVWDLGTPNGAIQGSLKAQLKGHRARVFNAVWNPLLHNLLLTGSDDTCARVWDLETNGSVELKGHTNNVRGLLWHTEMPNVCITGVPLHPVGPCIEAIEHQKMYPSLLCMTHAAMGIRLGHCFEAGDELLHWK